MTDWPKCPACESFIIELDGHVFSCNCGTYKDRPGFVAKREKRWMELDSSDVLEAKQGGKV